MAASAEGLLVVNDRIELIIEFVVFSMEYRAEESDWVGWIVAWWGLICGRPVILLPPVLAGFMLLMVLVVVRRVNVVVSDGVMLEIVFVVFVGDNPWFPAKRVARLFSETESVVED